MASKFTERLQKALEMLRSAVECILQQQDIGLTEWMDVLTMTSQVVIENDLPGHQRLSREIGYLVSEYIASAKTRIISMQDDIDLLQSYEAEWAMFCEHCRYIPLLLPMMKERDPSPKPTMINPKIKQLMNQAWNEEIFNAVKGRLMTLALATLKAERLGQMHDPQLVISVRKIYVGQKIEGEEWNSLRVYYKGFEAAYFEALRMFYDENARSYFEKNGLKAYLVYAEAKLKQEEQRARIYLEDAYEGDPVVKVFRCCINLLVVEFKDRMLSGYAAVLSESDIESLRSMFQLMKYVPQGLDLMAEGLQHKVQSTELVAMHKAAEIIVLDCDKYVEYLVDLFKVLMRWVTDVFDNNKMFKLAMDKTFHYLVNDTSVFKLEPTSKNRLNSIRPPESRGIFMIDDYINRLVRKCSSGKHLINDFAGKVNEVINVIKYIDCKDAFFNLYKKSLSRRLIVGISEDLDMEKHIFSHLRDIGIPKAVAENIENMFRDLDKSNDIKEDIIASLRKHDNALAEIVDLKILNSHTWSRATEEKVVSLSPEIDSLLVIANDLYSTMNARRKLYLDYQLTTALINFDNDVGKFELEVTTRQLAVLSTWNDRPRDRQSFRKLRLATKLPEEDTRHVLWSLVACPMLKNQVIHCSPEVTSSDKLTEDSQFWINYSFCLTKQGVQQKSGKVSLIFCRKPGTQN